MLRLGTDLAVRREYRYPTPGCGAIGDALKFAYHTPTISGVSKEQWPLVLTHIELNNDHYMGGMGLV